MGKIGGIYFSRSVGTIWTKKWKKKKRGKPNWKKLLKKNKRYTEYLAGDHWKEVRESFSRLNEDKKCYVCGKNNVHLEIHHKTYERIGHEKMEDLVYICRLCHDFVHILHNRFKEENKSITLSEMTEKAKRIYETDN